MAGYEPGGRTPAISPETRPARLHHSHKAGPGPARTGPCPGTAGNAWSNSQGTVCTLVCPRSRRRAGGGVRQPGPRTRFGRASPPPSPDCERYRSPRVLAVSRPRYPDTRPVPGARVDAPRVNAVATATRTDRAGLSAHYAARQARRKHVTELSVTGDDAGWEGALPPRYRGETAARSLSWSGRGRPWWGEPGIEGQPGVAPLLLPAGSTTAR